MASLSQIDRETGLLFRDYQKATATTAVYRDSVKDEQGRIGYCVLGLTGEAGEIANKFKKVLRGDYPLDWEHKVMIANELGDVLWYLSQLATELGVDLSVLANKNLDKLSARADAGTLRGSGDER